MKLHEQFPVVYDKIKKYLAHGDPEVRYWRFFNAVYSSNLPLRHRDTPLTAPHPAWVKTLQAFVQKLDTSFVATLLGGPGTAKTQLAVELCLIARASGLSAIYHVTADFFSLLKSSFDSTTPGATEQLLKDAKKVKLLVLDEVDKRQFSDFENTTLFQLADWRYRNCRDTLFIGNIQLPCSRLRPQRVPPNCQPQHPLATRPAHPRTPRIARPKTPHCHSPFAPHTGRNGHPGTETILPTLSCQQLLTFPLPPTSPRCQLRPKLRAVLPVGILPAPAPFLWHTTPVKTAVLARTQKCVSAPNSSPSPATSRPSLATSLPPKTDALPTT